MSQDPLGMRRVYLNVEEVKLPGMFVWCATRKVATRPNIEKQEDKQLRNLRRPISLVIFTKRISKPTWKKMKRR